MSSESLIYTDHLFFDDQPPIQRTLTEDKEVDKTMNLLADEAANGGSARLYAHIDPIEGKSLVLKALLESDKEPREIGFKLTLTPGEILHEDDLNNLMNLINAYKWMKGNQQLRESKHNTQLTRRAFLAGAAAAMALGAAGLAAEPSLRKLYSQAVDEKCLEIPPYFIELLNSKQTPLIEQIADNQSITGENIDLSDTHKVTVRHEGNFILVYPDSKGHLESIRVSVENQELTVTSEKITLEFRDVSSENTIEIVGRLVILDDTLVQVFENLTNSTQLPPKDDPIWKFLDHTFIFLPEEYIENKQDLE